jgi:hypothetical protein
MLHQRTAVKADPRPVVHSLSYTETAVALYASGVPSRRLRSATPEQLTEWASRGVEMAGLDKVRATARRTLALNLASTRKTGSTPAEDAEYSAIWPSSSIAQRCHDAAWGLIF